MPKSELWYSLEAVKDAIDDFKLKADAKFENSKPWSTYNFENYYTQLTQDYRGNIEEPTTRQRLLRRFLKCVPAISCCIGEYVDKITDTSAEKIADSIFCKSSFSDEQLSSIVSASEQLAHNGKSIFEEYFKSVTTVCSVVSVMTFFSSLALQLGTYGKPCGEAIKYAFKNAGTWVVPYVASSIGGFVGSLVRNKLGSLALAMPIAVLATVILLVGIKELSDHVNCCKRKSVNVAAARTPPTTDTDTDSSVEIVDMYDNDSDTD